MDEIRERVTLTNSTDETMVRRGLLSRAEVRRVVVDALVDVEAIRSVLPPEVADQLGVSVGDRWVTQSADGPVERVGVTGAVRFQCQARDTIDEALVRGGEVRIGRTVVAKLDLVADAGSRRLVPHPGRPNQPVSMVR